jgi:HAD superfamily hydrolase (TIGR01490 family)
MENNEACLAPEHRLPYNGQRAQHGSKEKPMRSVAALFDMDKTLLDASSGPLYARYLYRTGEIGQRQLLRVVWWSVLSRLGLLDLQNLIPRLLIAATGDDEHHVRRISEEWFAQDVLPHLTQRGRQRVMEHREKGHVVAIVSASTQYAVGPLAEYLGIPGQYVCTHLESQGGRLTGKVVPPICFGPGKVVWAERFAVEYQVDLAASVFYSDSISDRPLLERVGHPVAVNPDVRLRRLARSRGWPIESFY